MRPSIHPSIQASAGHPGHPGLRMADVERNNTFSFSFSRLFVCLVYFCSFTMDADQPLLLENFLKLPPLKPGTPSAYRLASCTLPP